MKIVFVCLGNICRSPTAEGVMRKLVRDKKLENIISVESRGTGGWHVGEPPDPRSQACAKKNGVDISDLRGRQFSTYDFELFDYILVMDESNYRDVIRLASTEAEKAKVSFLLRYSSQSNLKNVPDPYHGAHDGFQEVFDLIQDACQNLLPKLVYQT